MLNFSTAFKIINGEGFLQTNSFGKLKNIERALLLKQGVRKGKKRNNTPDYH